MSIFADRHIAAQGGAGFVRPALAYASHGWHVFPLQPRGKVPLIPGGFHQATTDVAQVREWWTRWPMANIGLHPGPSGVLVIDVDGPEGEQVARALDLFATPTLTAITGRGDGGRHLMYHRPPLARIGNAPLGPHLDVRCDVGYIVLAPSIHPSGTRYRWFAGPREIGALPPAALARLEDVNRPALVPPAPAEPITTPSNMDARISAYVDAVGPRGEGERNATAFRLAAWLQRDLALDASAAWSWLCQWNGRNTPPLPERELRACLTSARRTGRHAVGAGLTRPLFAPRYDRVRDPFAGCRRSEAVL